MPDLVSLLNGTIDWSDIGGPEAPLSLAATVVDAGSAQARLAEIAGILGVEARASISEVPDVESLITHLARAPGAAVLAHENIGEGDVIALSHGCEPGSAQGATGDAAPLMVHFWAYTAEPRLPALGRAFLVFLSSAEAQRVVDRAGFIDQRPRPIPLSQQGDRIARAVAALSDELTLIDLQRAVGRLRSHDRLSTVFRFEPGTMQLTRESENEAQSLAAILDAGRFDGRELLFTGLTDAVGDAASNQRVAERQAARALAEVASSMATRTDRVTMQSQGFGELFPLACDDNPWGRHVNRRVEVWIGPRH